MGSINASVDLRHEDGIALITLQNPPVNALKHELREGVAQALERAKADPSVLAAVIAGSERAFCAGADISEFGKPPRGPSLRDLILALDAFPKPVVAAIKGVALGGGLELAMGCHYRVGWLDARLGLPEIKLGIIPGAGGTQRLPRLISPEKALKAIMSGEPIAAAEAKDEGLLDALVDGSFPEAAVRWTRDLLRDARPLRRVRDRDDRVAAMRADPKALEAAAEPLLKRARGSRAAQAAAAAVKAAVEKPFEDGEALEHRLFQELVKSDESRAQRHIFFAEREAQKVPGMSAGVQPKKIDRAVVIGAGTMGGGIAMCFANVGIPVVVIEADAEALKRGLDRVEANYRTAVQRGSLAEADMRGRLELIEATTDFGRAATGDVVIEAVFEDMKLKEEIFGRLDAVAKPGALLASNTSYLDIDAIAAATQRPGDVLGMHFFSPANVMRLLEIVRGVKTSHEALATAIAVGRRIGKVTAVVGNCDGFVGNRMLARRSTQSEKLLLEGALPHQIDEVVVEFGFPMGPFAMGDLAGLDVGWRARKARGIKAPVADALAEAGRFGQKTGAGYYRYNPGSRVPVHDPEVERLALEASRQAGITRRSIAGEEILDRMILPMLNEGARVLEEGIAARPSDIDVIWVFGYGWPAWRGGPMWYADQVGLATVRDKLERYAGETGDDSLHPAPLLARLAAEGRGFASLGARAAAA